MPDAGFGGGPDNGRDGGYGAGYGDNDAQPGAGLGDSFAGFGTDADRAENDPGLDTGFAEGGSVQGGRREAAPEPLARRAMETIFGVLGTVGGAVTLGPGGAIAGNLGGRALARAAFDQTSYGLVDEGKLTKEFEQDVPGTVISTATSGLVPNEFARRGINHFAREVGKSHGTLSLGDGKVTGPTTSSRGTSNASLASAAQEQDLTGSVPTAQSALVGYVDIDGKHPTLG